MIVSDWWLEPIGMTAALYILHERMAVPIEFLPLPLTATNSALLTLLPATELGFLGWR